MSKGKILVRDEIKAQDRWDVEAIYSSNETWEADLVVLKEKAPKLKDFSGKLSNANTLLECLKVSEEVNRLAEKLLIYAALKSDEDTANPTYQVLRSKIESYLAELGSFSAYFVPEILELEDGTIQRLISENGELKLYEFYLLEILKTKEHALSAKEEALLAGVSDCLEAPGNIYGAFTNADMRFPKIKDEDGNEIELTEANYSLFIKSKDRTVREAAFKALFNTYGNYKNMLSNTLTSSIKNMAFNAKLRNYKSSLESSLKPNNIPVEVYETAINTVTDNIAKLHRYVKVKKQLLKLEDMHMYDLYVSLIDIGDEDIPFDQGVDIVLDGIASLGQEYIDIFKEGVKKGWIDKYPNKGKRGGAYSWGCYDTMPYILLNYTSELRDVFTLAHEVGHSIHSYYSKKNQPYIYSHYELFCAEVASTTNEILLMNHLIEKETDKTKKLYLINYELEQIRTTVFRQMMFAEFEKITHEKIETGNPLSAEDYCKIWKDLNIKYFGPDMVVDDEIEMEWSRIPHFYSDFYVYQYATGYSAAAAFANSILNNEENAVEKYKDFLKSGGRDYPIEILKDSGVDMTTSKPMEAVFERFNQLLDMMEEVVLGEDKK